ncbi:MAG TPA: alpha/beta hydrolase [Burkholderiaceae bacterium]|nr:alpha/beta hydrolase [Burkholderiaceae bacterium]
MGTSIVTGAVAVGSLQFEVDRCGPADGPAVLLLHGFPQSRWAFRRQLPALAAAGFHAVAPSQRGYSAGARPAGTEHYAADRIVDDALALMDRLQTGRFHLVGHDWGGQIAWMLAARAPQRLLSLTVLSRPHPAAFARAFAADPDQPGRSRHHKALLDAGAPAALRADDMAAFRRMFAAQRVPAEDADAYCDALRPAGALEAAIEWYRASATAMRNHDFPPVACDTLYLWGDGDSSVGRMAAEGTAAFVTGRFRFVAIPGAGHFLTDEVPEVVNRELLAHLSAR